VTRQEKLIVLLLSLVVLARVGHIGIDIWFAHTYGGMASVVDRANLKSISTLWEGLVNLGAAIWIFVEARAAGLRAWLWSILGLCVGIFGIALFYLVQTYNHNRART
jgi:hypothetical protein